ncbi:MAG: HugZ family protein [Burkholderiales bacterium]
MSDAEQARRLLRSRRHGVLATLSKKLGGYPFGSVLPYMLDHDARPVILISTLAEHTKNILADPRVSLLVHEPFTDVQAHARATLVGKAQRLVDQDALKPRYLRYFPNAESYFATHDFHFFRIEPHMVRYIGGFGEIHWVSSDSYHPPRGQLAEQEDGIVAHMNQDHAQNMRDYCRRYHGREVAAAHMLGIDCDGFDVRADGDILRFDFEQPVLDAVTARKALVAMAQESRAA